MREGHKTGFARHLRGSMTDAEARLWFHLRNRAFIGRKFRRQHPIGPYIADFACPEARLVVELDGGQHVEARDAIRTACLEARGYHVLRFWNNDVLTQMEAVLAAVLAELSARTAPHSSPIPQAMRAPRG